MTKPPKCYCGKRLIYTEHGIGRSDWDCPDWAKHEAAEAVEAEETNNPFAELARLDTMRLQDRMAGEDY